MTKGILRRAKSLGGRGLTASSEAVNGAAKLVEQRRGGIVDATRGLFDGSGRISENAGRGLVRACDDLSQRRQTLPRGKDGDLFGVATDVAADWAIGLGALAGRSIDRFGGATRKVSPAVGEAAGSVVVGMVGTVSGAVDAFAITQADFTGLESRLATAGETARTRSRGELARITMARRLNQRGELLDLLTIGGMTIAEMVRDPAKVPPEVERAFELSYPELAEAGHTFADAAARLPAEHLIGLVSGVKGKLFELALVDQLNHGGLADGLHAELASSATQPGYDILIRDAHGNTLDVLQAKATDSVAYVKDALERYPNIDISTTSEVHTHLMALGLTEHVSDSGIAESALQHKVEAAAGIGGHLDAGDFVPSALGLAVIAFSAFTATGASWEARAAAFGDRAAKAGMAGAAAKAALIATNTWWLAVAGGVGLRVIVGKGDAKRQRLDALKGIVESLEMDNRRHRRALARPVFS